MHVCMHVVLCGLRYALWWDSGICRVQMTLQLGLGVFFTDDVDSCWVVFWLLDGGVIHQERICHKTQLFISWTKSNNNKKKKNVVELFLEPLFLYSAGNKVLVLASGSSLLCAQQHGSSITIWMFIEYNMINLVLTVWHHHGIKAVNECIAYCYKCDDVLLMNRNLPRNVLCSASCGIPPWTWLQPVTTGSPSSQSCSEEAHQLCPSVSGRLSLCDAEPSWSAFTAWVCRALAEPTSSSNCSQVSIKWWAAAHTGSICLHQTKNGLQ